MKSFLILGALSAAVLAACSAEQHKLEVNAADYAVKNAQALQYRINALNKELGSNYRQLKQQQNIAFSDQSALDVNHLQTLHLHAVSATSLKPVKQQYCALMNGYFNELYRLGHFNLSLMSQVQLGGAVRQDLSSKFASAEAFYNYALTDYSSYKQAQQIMGYGCNLRASLSPA